jgi:hypothetical protein
MLSELRLVYYAALVHIFARWSESGASNDRSSSLCNAPSKGSLETDSFWAIGCRGCPGTVIDS